MIRGLQIPQAPEGGGEGEGGNGFPLETRGMQESQRRDGTNNDGPIVARVSPAALLQFRLLSGAIIAGALWETH